MLATLHLPCPLPSILHAAGRVIPLKGKSERPTPCCEPQRLSAAPRIQPCSVLSPHHAPAIKGMASQKWSVLSLLPPQVLAGVTSSENPPVPEWTGSGESPVPWVPGPWPSPITAPPHCTVSSVYLSVSPTGLQVLAEQKPHLPCTPEHPSSQRSPGHVVQTRKNKQKSLLMRRIVSSLMGLWKVGTAGKLNEG